MALLERPSRLSMCWYGQGLAWPVAAASRRNAKARYLIIIRDPSFINRLHTNLLNPAITNRTKLSTRYFFVHPVLGARFFSNLAYGIKKIVDALHTISGNICKRFLHPRIGRRPKPIRAEDGHREETFTKSAAPPPGP